MVQLWVAVILSDKIPSISSGAQESHSKVNLIHIGLDPPLQWAELDLCLATIAISTANMSL